MGPEIRIGQILMKIKKSRKNTSSKKVLYTTLAALLLIAASCVVYVYAFNGTILGWSSSPKTSIKNSDENQENTTEVTDTPITEPSKGNSPSTEVPNDMTVIFSAVNQTETVLQIRVLIEAVLGSGKCTLTLTKGADSINKIAPTQALASSSTCTGFDIPLAELSTGEWQVNLSVSSGSSGGSAQKVVTVE